MSETDAGTPWPPGGSDDQPATEDTSPDSEPVETPDRYTPDYLAEYQVSVTPHGGIQLSLGNPALSTLYAVPGDRLRVYDHPDGILVTHAGHQRGGGDE